MVHTLLRQLLSGRALYIVTGGFLALFLTSYTVVGATADQVSVLRNTDFTSTSYWTNAKFFTVVQGTLRFDVGDRTGKRWLQQDLRDSLVGQREYTFTGDIELTAAAEVTVRLMHNHSTHFFKDTLPAGRHTIASTHYIAWKQAELEKAKLQILVYDSVTNRTIPYVIHDIDLTYQTPVDLLSGLQSLLRVDDKAVYVDGALVVDELRIGEHIMTLTETGDLCIGACPTQFTEPEPVEVVTEEEDMPATDPVVATTSESGTDLIDQTATTSAGVATTSSTTATTTETNS